MCTYTLVMWVASYNYQWKTLQGEWGGVESWNSFIGVDVCGSYVEYLLPNPRLIASADVQLTVDFSQLDICMPHWGRMVDIL